MRAVRIRLIVDIGYDEAEFTNVPMFQRMADDPIDLAAVHLDRAVADARQWLAARKDSDDQGTT